MAELLNASKNELDDEMLEAYDTEMEKYLAARDRQIGGTAFEALAVGLAKAGVEAGFTNPKETPYGDGDDGSSLDADWVDA